MDNMKLTIPQKYLLKTLIVFLIGVITLIGLKASQEFKASFYTYVLKDNLSMPSINKVYKEIFGSPFPFNNLFNIETTPTFSEKLIYSEKNLYKDGVKLIVSEKYLVPALDNGLVIFTGTKEDYGNVIIVEQENGIELWYGNIETSNLKLYDYIEKGSLIGEVNSNYFYLVFKKSGEILDYEEYI